MNSMTIKCEELPLHAEFQSLNFTIIVIVACFFPASVSHGQESNLPITNPMELRPLIENIAQYDALLYACTEERDGALRKGLADREHMFDWQKIGDVPTTGSYSSRLRAQHTPRPESIEDVLVAYDEAFELSLANARDVIRRRDEQRRADPCTDQRLEQQRDAAGIQAVRIQHPSFMYTDSEDPE